MSIVSSVFSIRPSSRINARIAFFMDNLFAIGFGLGLRFIVDSVSHHDFKLTGTLVGLWEGVVTLHFVKKMPKSSDPYIAYVVRLFVDFLVTESLARMVLVLVWTGLGMVLADIAPAIWVDVGGHRIWRRFRRDLYHLSRSLPPVFPRARVVRFSPNIEPAEISETMSTLSPSAVTPTTQVVPPTPAPPRVSKRPIPGGFAASVVSETDTDLGSVLGFRQGAGTSGVGTAHHRLSVRPRRPSFGSATPASSATNDLDDDSNSSSGASSTSTETASQAAEIQDEIEEPVRVRHKGKGRATDQDDSTPTQQHIELPPTPSDSNRPHPHRTSVVPTISGMPSIPDFEPGLGSDWETIHKEDVPPVPPEKNPSPPPRFVPPPAPSTFGDNTPRPASFDQDLWDSVSNAAPPEAPKKVIAAQRPSRPPVNTGTRAPTTSAKPRLRTRSAKQPTAPAIPVYGNTWDTEQDQLPPPTPSVALGTPHLHPTEPPQSHTNQADTTPPAGPGDEFPPPPAADAVQWGGVDDELKDDPWADGGGETPWESRQNPDDDGILDKRDERPQGDHQQEQDQKQLPKKVTDSQDQPSRSQWEPSAHRRIDSFDGSVQRGTESHGLPNQPRKISSERREPVLFDDFIQKTTGSHGLPDQSQQTPSIHQQADLFGDFAQQVFDLGGGPDVGLSDPAEQFESEHARDPVNLGDSNVTGEGGQTSEPADADNAGDTQGEGGGDDNDGVKDKGKEKETPSEVGSSAESAYSSVAGVPEVIKERNKQAIIIRAQIAELEQTIERLKDEKTKALGKEELDPLLEESTLKEAEIKRAERTLEKLKKRAEKRYQAAVDSTNQLSLPKNVNLSNSSPDEAVARLEDLLGLFFNADRKAIHLAISLPKGGAGKATTTAVQKLLEEYGVKFVPGMGRVAITVSHKPYIDFVNAFRHKHSQPDDS